MYLIKNITGKQSTITHKKAYTTSSNTSCCYGGCTHNRGIQHCQVAESTCHTCSPKGHWPKVCLANGNNMKPERQDYHKLNINAITDASLRHIYKRCNTEYEEEKKYIGVYR